MTRNMNVSPAATGTPPGMEWTQVPSVQLPAAVETAGLPYAHDVSWAAPVQSHDLSPHATDPYHPSRYITPTSSEIASHNKRLERWGMEPQFPNDVSANRLPEYPRPASAEPAKYRTSSGERTWDEQLNRWGMS